MNYIRALVVLLFVTVSALAAPQRMATVYLQDVNALVDDLVTLAETLEVPLPPEVIRGQLGNLVMADDLGGLDMSSPLYLMIAAEGETPLADPAVASFSVLGDGREYLELVRQRLPEHEEVSPGLHRFHSGQPEDATSFYVLIDGLQAWAGRSLEVMEACRDVLPATDREILEAMPGGLGLSVDLPALTRMMESTFETQKRMMEELKARMEAEGQDTTGMFKPEAMAGMQSAVEAMKGLTGQLEALVMNLDFDRDITLRAYLRGREGSAARRILATLQPPPAKVAGFRDERAYLTAYGTMNGLDEVIEPYAEWISGLYRQMGPPMDALAEPYRNMLTGIKGVYRGGFNFVLLPPQEDGWLQGMGLYEIHDAETARQAMEDLIEAQMKELSGGEGMPFAMNLVRGEAEPYAGVSIDSRRFEYQFKEDIESTLPGLLPDFLKNMNYHAAYLDGYMAYALGDVAHLHRLIDYLQSGEEPAVEHRGFEEVDGEVVGFWEWDIGKMVAALPGMSGPPGLAELSAGLRGLAVKDREGITAMLRLTGEDLSRIKKAAESFMPKPAE